MGEHNKGKDEDGANCCKGTVVKILLSGPDPNKKLSNREVLDTECNGLFS